MTHRHFDGTRDHSFIYHLISKVFYFGNEKRLERLRALVERRFFRIVVSAIVENFRHVADKLAQILVLTIGDTQVNGSEIYVK